MMMTVIMMIMMMMVMMMMVMMMMMMVVKIMTMTTTTKTGKIFRQDNPLKTKFGLHLIWYIISKLHNQPIFYPTFHSKTNLSVHKS